jgi:prepilin-type N-terminal cleavage/methylation domain-containing protein
MTRRRAFGFTMVELMISVLIVARNPEVRVGSAEGDRNADDG